MEMVSILQAVCPKDKKKSRNRVKTYLKCTYEAWNVIFLYAHCKTIVVEHILIWQKNSILQCKPRGQIGSSKTSHDGPSLDMQHNENDGVSPELLQECILEACCLPYAHSSHPLAGHHKKQSLLVLHNISQFVNR
jgi:hypothetical protein